MIKFNASSHWYDKEGKPSHDSNLRDARKKLLYPSVTSIDKDVFPNQFLERWKLNQLVLAASENPKQPHEDGEHYSNRIYEISMEKANTAAAFGTKIHKAAESWPSAPSSDLMPWFMKFDQWMNDNKVVPVARERIVVNHQLGVAGTADLSATVNGIPFVIDYKTQDVKVNDKGKKVPAYYDSWLRQLAFYYRTLQFEGRMMSGPMRIISLIIDSNENGDVYSKTWTAQEGEDAYAEFEAGAWLFFRKRDYWPVGKWSIGRI